MQIWLLAKKDHPSNIKSRCTPLLLDRLDVLCTDSFSIIAHARYLVDAMMQYRILGPA